MLPLQAGHLEGHHARGLRKHQHLRRRQDVQLPVRTLGTSQSEVHRCVWRAARCATCRLHMHSLQSLHPGCTLVHAHCEPCQSLTLLIDSAPPDSDHGCESCPHRYFPPGNYLDSFPENVRRAGKK
jgi:hypothetical protein